MKDVTLIRSDISRFPRGTVFGESDTFFQSAEVHVPTKIWSESLTILCSKSIDAGVVLLALYLAALVLVAIVETH